MAGLDAVPITSWLVDQHDCADGPIRTEEVNVVEIEQRPPRSHNGTVRRRVAGELASYARAPSSDVPRPHRHFLVHAGLHTVPDAAEKQARNTSDPNRMAVRIVSRYASPALGLPVSPITGYPQPPAAGTTHRPARCPLGRRRRTRAAARILRSRPRGVNAAADTKGSLRRRMDGRAVSGRLHSHLNWEHRLRRGPADNLRPLDRFG